MSTDNPQSINLGLQFLQESPSNPRKRFDPNKLTELAESVRLHGVLQDLLVRPRWCVGLATRAEVEAKQGRGDLQSSPFEILAGARRFRAATSAGLSAVPCKVRCFTDAEAFDIQLIENLQRDDLTPIEEAQGFHDALQLQIEGRPVHTVESLAARLNKSQDHIYRMLKLVDLPKEMRDAVEQGVLPVRQAALIARVPDKTARLEAGRKVLHGHGQNQPLTSRETDDLLQSEYRRDLAGAPFSCESTMLLPGAGSCTTCPHRTGNMPDFDAKQGKGANICTKPSCYQQKADAAYKAVVLQAQLDGKIELAPAEAARHFDALGELVFTTTLARLGQKPREDQLKVEVKRAPTWGQLAELARSKGFDAPILIARNPKTLLVEELVDSAPLIAAAKKIGEPIFRGGKEDEPLFTSKKAGEDDDDALRRGQRELEEKRKDEAIALAAEQRKKQDQAAEAFQAVLEAVTDDTGPILPYLEIALTPMIDFIGTAGRRFIVEHFELKADNGPFGHIDAIVKYVRNMSPTAAGAFLLMLPLVPDLLAAGIESAPLRAFAKRAGVDLKEVTAVAKRVKKKAAPPPKKPKAKAAPKGKKRGAK